MVKMCQGPDPNPTPPRRGRRQGKPHAFPYFRARGSLPLPAGARSTPPDASVASYMKVHRTMGLSRAVLVQPSMYGTDNRRQLDAAREMDIPTRTIVVVPVTVADAEIEALHAQGARGVRFNPSQPGSLPLDQLDRFAERLAGFGWHIQLMLTPAQLIELAPRLVSCAARS